MSNFKTRLQNRDYPARIVEKHLSKIKFSDREMSLAQKNKTKKTVLDSLNDMKIETETIL